jgi:uroporphyrin-III C-methyltransferase
MADDKDPKDSNKSSADQQKKQIRTSDKPVPAPQSNSTSDKASEHKSSASETKKSADQNTASHSAPSQLFNAKPLPKMHAKRSKTDKLIPAIIGLLLIAAIIISAWTLYQQQLFTQDWQQMQSRLDNQISDQTSVIKQAQTASQASLQTIGQTQNQVNQLSQSNRQLSESLFSTQERIKELSGRKKQDWMLAEASYLIKIAQLQLTLQKDKNTATQLLKTADSRLIELADNSLLPIRQAIAKDLSDLSLIIEPDVVGLAYSLDAVSKQIPQLEIAAFQFTPLEKQHSQPLVEEQSKEFELKQIYQKFLKDFVVIKDHSEPVKPLMSTDQRANLNSNIQLAIQQAQIAIAQGNKALYQLHINNAIDWVNEFFINNEKTSELVRQLNQLKTQAITVNYPQSLRAKKALDEISQQQVYRWLENSMPKNNSNNPQSNEDGNETQLETDDVSETDSSSEQGGDQ